MADDLVNIMQRMGTTENEEAVLQFKGVVGEVSTEVAVFFLESCCWNVQQAISSYYESGASSNGGNIAELMQRQGQEPVPEPQLVFSDLGGPDHGNLVLPPGTPFQKSLLVRNPGPCSWPSGCYLAAADGAPLPGDRAVQVPSLGPGETTTLTLSLFAPHAQGTHASTWRFYHSQGQLSESAFGDAVWVVATVDPSVGNAMAEDPTSSLLHGLSVSALQGGGGGGDMAE